MDLFEILKNNSEMARASLSSIIKIILLLSISYSIYFHLWRILFINILLLILIFTPYILRKKLEIHIPTEFELILLFFVIVSFFLGEFRGFVIQVFFGLAIGFIGFTLMMVLYSNSKMRTSYFLIILFSFSFSVALGLGAEMSKYYLKMFLGYELTMSDYIYAMQGLTLVSIGALFASILGYAYMKGHKIGIMSKLVSKFKKKNPNLFVMRTDSPEEIIELIKKGEKEKLEFKSTLRTNLYTRELDKEMENSVLRTIVAFLNSEGGILLVGVSDSGEIMGIEKDNFQSNDRFALHFTNMIKEKIGNEYLPYISSELVFVDGKTILKVECRKSESPVFLKIGKTEEFYIRVGPATVKIFGSKLIQYIKSNFRI